MGTAPTAIAVADGALWVADAHEDVVRRVDLRTRRTIATIPVGRAPYGIVAAFGSIWVTNADDGTVSRIDLHTNAHRRHHPPGREPVRHRRRRERRLGRQPGHRHNRPHRPRLNRTLPPVRVGDDPLAIAAAPTGLWVTTDTEGAVIHIPSLR